jgi:hypothetical protein
MTNPPIRSKRLRSRLLFCSRVSLVVVKRVFVPNPKIHFQFATKIHIFRCLRMVITVAPTIGLELVKMHWKAEPVIYKFGFQSILCFDFAFDPKFRLLGMLRSVQN